MPVRGERHVPAVLLPGKRPGTHCIWGRVDRRVGLDGYWKSRPSPLLLLLLLLLLAVTVAAVAAQQ